MNLQDRRSSPFFKPSLKVSDIMQGVIMALIPGIMVMFWLYGWGVIINLLLSICFSLAFEAISLSIRRRPVKQFLHDKSALLTAILLAIALPTLAPWWLIFIGCFFAIVVSKQLYGGLGYNVFNPAMVAYAILIISFPEQMSSLWQSSVLMSDHVTHLDLLSSLTFQFFGDLPANISIDALTAATPLDSVKTAINSGSASISELKNQMAVYGFFAGQGSEWVNLSFLIGGCWMIYKNYISWHIPVTFISTLFFASLIFGYLVDVDANPSPLFHLFSGATMLGAFFIATDPVTSATTNRGKLIFGAGVGLLVYIIRSWGGYPDAIAFAVIIMNITVPFIDYYTRPRVYGHE